MKFQRISLTNWKNFRQIDVELAERTFLVGPNASGKSNFLDVFRFLRDLASSSGGLQRACEERGGLSKIRSLHARNPSTVGIRVELVDEDHSNKQILWSYELAFRQQTRFPKQGTALIEREIVKKNGEILLERPNERDADDKRLKEQTALEQLSENKAFRDIADHFEKVSYLHLVPQMIRNASGSQADQAGADMYGGRFVETIAQTQPRRRKAMLKKIEDVLKITVPQLEELELTTDSRGIPHLEARYKHWRPQGGRQDESQFSDGTLRLIGLLWALQDGNGLILIEEPELSLHTGIIRQLAPFIHKAQTRKDDIRQTFVSTHSVDLLSDEGVSADELLVFIPTDEGTQIARGTDIRNVAALMNSGLTAGEVVFNFSEYDDLKQLRLFEL